MGAWIEISDKGQVVLDPFMVAPLVGAWIEMHRRICGRGVQEVAPLVGAWIEING